MQITPTGTHTYVASGGMPAAATHAVLESAQSRRECSTCLVIPHSFDIPSTPLRHRYPPLAEPSLPLHCQQQISFMRHCFFQLSPWCNRYDGSWMDLSGAAQSVLPPPEVQSALAAVGRRVRSWCVPPQYC